MPEYMLARYGRVRLTQIVSSFYSHVLKSPTLSRYFDEVSIAGLIEHQSRFLGMVLGGPPAYSAQELEVAHKRFGITNEDFDEMLHLLEESLDRYEVDPEDVSQVMLRYRAMQTAVVKPGKSGPEPGTIGPTG
jgi:hemoglobin